LGELVIIFAKHALILIESWAWLENVLMIFGGLNEVDGVTESFGDCDGAGRLSYDNGWMIGWG
jgi:hypothetical protein